MSKRPIRVVHVVLNLDHGGLERVVAELVRRSDPLDVEHHVLCLNYFGHMASALEGHATLHLAPPLTFRSWWQSGQLGNVLRELRPDVVHSHSGVWFKASAAARDAGAPLIMHTDHGRLVPDPWLNRLVDSVAARRTDVVVAVSDELAQQLTTTVRVPPTRLRVVRNGVDTSHFAPGESASLRSALDLPPGRPILGSIGRFDAVKAYDVMLEAMSMRRAAPEATRPYLVLVGAGPQRDYLLAQIGARGLGNDVTMLPWRDDIPEMLRVFDIFTMSSRSEGTSMSLLEAMSAGVPPIITDVGGNRSVLGRHLAHCLVPANNPAALASAWHAAFADPGRLKQDGEAARARVRDAYSLDAMVTAYTSLYADAPRRDVPTKAASLS